MIRVFLGLLLIHSAAMASPQVQAFLLLGQTLGNVSSQRVTVCYLDAFSRDKQVLDQRLHEQRDKNNIEALVKKASPQLSDDYQCLAQAKQLGITNVPAVVINSQYVVYGQLNLANVLAQVKQSTGGGHEND